MYYFVGHPKGRPLFLSLSVSQFVSLLVSFSQEVEKMSNTILYFAERFFYFAEPLFYFAERFFYFFIYKNLNIQIYKNVLLFMQADPGSTPEQGEALAKLPELYWDFNESIPRPLGGQEVPRNGVHPQDIVSFRVTMVYWLLVNVIYNSLKSMLQYGW